MKWMLKINGCLKRCLAPLTCCLCVLVAACGKKDGAAPAATSSKGVSAAPSTSPHKIIATLSSPNRNILYVTLWTLEQNGVALPNTISLDHPYVQIAPHLQRLAQSLSQLSQSRLDELDRSLDYYNSIYSPVWSDDTWVGAPNRTWIRDVPQARSNPGFR